MVVAVANTNVTQQHTKEEERNAIRYPLLECCRWPRGIAVSYRQSLTASIFLPDGRTPKTTHRATVDDRLTVHQNL
jgi:hypothetical protein